MDRETYAKWHNHPLRTLLHCAAGGDHLFPDEIDDMNLPPRLRAGFLEAAKQVAAADRQAGALADTLSIELFEALPLHHETKAQHETRRAAAGDAVAMANRNAARQATEDLADEIYRRSHGA